MSEKPQGETAVLQLYTKVTKHCTIYLDRFFTGIGVVEALLNENKFIIGTIQKNLPKGLI